MRATQMKNLFSFMVLMIVRPKKLESTQIAVAFYLRFTASASIAAACMKEYCFPQPDLAASV
jgi:hypothetical protein